jgi:predicted ArsR family transcriptional regulator
VKTVAEQAGQAQAGEQSSTRERLLALLLSLGPSTATVLADRLQVSPAGVRRHLDALVADGTVTTREDRGPVLRGRGRPARRYVLTDAGHAAGPSAYDDLAVDALRFLSASGGTQAVEAFARGRVAELEERYRDRLDGADDRTVALAEALSGDGYAATASPHVSGVQLCQHHCPVQHVAAEFPQLCDAETAALGRLLGVHVQRLATIAHGDGVCTTFVPLAAAPTAPAVPPGTTPQSGTPQSGTTPQNDGRPRS